jgi:class 3 adenylate cyclase
MQCPRCQEENPAGSTFCLGCGASLDLTCGSCGTGLPVGSKFCNKCGSPVSGLGSSQARLASPAAYTPKHLAEKILTSKAALEGERKQVTVLFCDVIGSTALAERTGADAMHSILNRFFDLALTAVHRYEGTINQFLGDGFMALFGAPLAHEDHARRALLSALAIQRRLREEASGLASGFSVRFGINTGLVVVGKIGDNLRMDYTAIGDTTHLAARLQQVAKAGSIDVSEATYRQTQHYFQYQAMGSKKLKGFSESVNVYRVLGPRAPITSAQGTMLEQGVSSPLVGRSAEAARLAAAVERLAEGLGSIVFIIGEAGLGKSRLFTEVRRQVGVRNVLWLEGRGLSFAKTISYFPFITILRSWASITDDDSEPQCWAKLEASLAELIPGQLDDTLPYLATLIGIEVQGRLKDRVRFLDARAMGGQIFQAARRFLEQLARTRPVALVFEDLHWVDQSSTELLEHLFPLVENVPLLICCLRRPEIDSPAMHLTEVAASRHAPHFVRIGLPPLSDIDCLTLLRNLLKRDPAPEVCALVLGKAEGNPFFIEEVIRALIDMNALTREIEGGWQATMSVDEVAIPATIEGVIMARIDRLADSIKDILKLASVIGRQFLYRVLREIASEVERELNAHLAELQKVELIRERRHLPELEYIFKHALVQEATYTSILVQRRRELHHEVARCIETLFAERLDDFYGVLAYHYARAEDWERAQEYLFKAGDQAGRVAADAEALAHYRDAVKAYQRAFGDRWDPRQRAVLDRKMGEALFRRGEHEQALEYLRRALRGLGIGYPTSRTTVRLAILKEVLRQVWHRWAPGVLPRPGGEVSPIAHLRGDGLDRLFCGPGAFPPGLTDPAQHIGEERSTRRHRARPDGVRRHPRPHLAPHD